MYKTRHRSRDRLGARSTWSQCSSHHLQAQLRSRQQGGQRARRTQSQGEPLYNSTCLTSKKLSSCSTKPSRPFGKLDIVVSNAGIDEVTPQDLHRVFAVNTRGQLLIAQQAYKHCNYGGRLILLSCMGANARGIKDHTIYQGQQSFYRSLRQFSYLRIWFSTYLILQ